MGDLIRAFANRYPLIHSLFTTRLRFSLTVLAGVFVATAYTLYGTVIASADGLFTPQGPILGADFFVFYRAALVAGGPQMAAIYDMAVLSEMLRTAYPGHGDMLFGWQYPPTMSLLIKPLSSLPYLWAFAVWVGAFLLLFLKTLHSLWRDRFAIYMALASPAVFHSIITGQTGLLTASLFALCVFFADRRPVLAGVAAALLTVKPQLGLLIPVAFVAAGCWRAFAVATLGAVIFAGASIAAFGVEPWQAFYEAVRVHSDRMSLAGVFPAYKLVTPFGVATLFGATKSVALVVQAIVSLGMAVFVFMVWRRVRDPYLRLAAIAAAAPLATPYAFYYEAAFFVPPVFALARCAVRDGWMKGEGWSVAGLWIATLFLPGAEGSMVFPTSFAVALAVLVVVARRALPAAGVSFAAIGHRAPTQSA
jgi:hypothetical protein